MGREIHRVPLDFDWPLNQPWQGYFNLYYEFCHECPDCENGYYEYGQYLNNLWYNEYVKKLATRNVTCSPQYYGG